MNKYVVLAQTGRVHTGILRLTPEQAEARIHGFPLRLEPLASPNCYRVLRPVSFKKGDEFFHCGSELGPGFAVVSEGGLIQKATDLIEGLGYKIKNSRPEPVAPVINPSVVPASAGAIPLAGGLPASEPMTAKKLFAELGLQFMPGKALLKREYDFDVKNNDTEIPEELVQKIKAVPAAE